MRNLHVQWIYQKSLTEDLDVSLQSHHEELTELDRAVFDKVVNDRDTLLEKAKSLMSQYLDLGKPCFDGGPMLFSIEITGVTPTAYRACLEFTFENDSNVYWSVVFNIPLMIPPLQNLDKSSYWPIEMAWKVEYQAANNSFKPTNSRYAVICGLTPTLGSRRGQLVYPD